MRTHLSSLRFALSLIAAVGFLGCATGSDGESCTRNSECAGECVNGQCAAAHDAARPDAATTDVSGGTEDARPGIDGGVSVDAAAEDDAAAVDAGGMDAPLPRDTGVRVDVPMGPCSAAGCIATVLRDGASAWTSMPADATSPFAPLTPVVAAFDIESLDVAYVLTSTTFHLLRLTDGAYIASGSLGARFPGLIGQVLNATSIPAGHAGGDSNLEGVTFATRDEVFPFEFNLTTERFRQSADPIDYSDDWDTALAPDRNAVLGAWLALENDDGWVPGSPRDSCGAGASAFAVYIAFIADGRVHFFDAGHCFDFVAVLNFSSFEPFQRPNAPDFAGVGGSFYHQGDLWIVNARVR